MVNTIRRFQQPLLIAITILVIISFVWLYNDYSTQPGRGGSDFVGQIYDRKISRTDVQRAMQRFQLCRDLQLIELLESLAGRDALMAMFMGRGGGDRGAENFIWNSLVLRHEAKALGIDPTDDAVIEAIKALPVFQTNGAYDSSKFAMFSQEAMGPRGATQQQLEELIRDNLRLTGVKALLGSTVEATPAELRQLFERRSQKTEASVVRLKLDDFKAAVQLSEDDLKKAYEERKEGLKAPEKRKVKYVAFTLAKQEKPLAGKERIAELEKLANKAGDFAVAMTEKDAKFEDVAAKFEVPVMESQPFAESEPPAELGDSDAVAGEAFRLTKEQPHSDPVSAENGYYVMQLGEVMEPRPLTFEEAKDQLTAQLKDERAREAMNLKATEIRNKIDAELKVGKSFAEAAQAAGATAEQFPAFSPKEPKTDQPDGSVVMGRATEMTVGELSEFLPTGTGGLLVHVDKRLPLEEAEFEKEKPTLVQGLERFKREAVFQEWLKARRQAANVQGLG
jgi:peptidyl-prolyl cis-trans isomerase D